MTTQEIQIIVAGHFKLTLSDLILPCRERRVAEPRMIAMYLCRIHTADTYSEIGRHFGNRNHSTVIHAIDTVDDMLYANKKVRNEVNLLTEKINAGNLNQAAS